MLSALLLVRSGEGDISLPGRIRLLPEWRITKVLNGPLVPGGRGTVVLEWGVVLADLAGFFDLGVPFLYSRGALHIESEEDWCKN